MKSLVVTGSHGFIGTNLVHAFTALPEYSTIICCDLLEGLLRNRGFLPAQLQKIVCVPEHELIDFLRSQPFPPSAIIHNGACSSTEETNPQIFETLNLASSKKLWQYCVEMNIPFIYASSASVYGDGSKGFSDAKEALSQYKPLNLYAESKWRFDCWVLEQSQTPPTWFGLRYFNVYGPWEEHKKRQASMVLHGFRQILETGKVRLYKSTSPLFQDGEQKRDFIYVKDIVDITIKLLNIAEMRKNSDDFPIDGNGLFVNLGTGFARSWNDMMRCIFAELGKPCNIEYIPMPEQLAKQYQNFTQAELGGLQTLGISHNFCSLEQGISEYIQQYLLPRSKA